MYCMKREIILNRNFEPNSVSYFLICGGFYCYLCFYVTHYISVSCLGNKHVYLYVGCIMQRGDLARPSLFFI